MVSKPPKSDGEGQKRSFTLQELSSLLSVLSADSIQSQTFEQISTSLKHYFPNKTDNFKVGNAIVTLLRHPDLLNSQSQRVTCIFLLYDMYMPEPVLNNPFVTVFHHFLQKNDRPKLSLQENYFLSQLVTMMPKDGLYNLLIKKTPAHILHMDSTACQSVDVSQFMKSVEEHIAELTTIGRCAVPCVVAQPEQFQDSGAKTNQISVDTQRQTLEAIMATPNPCYDRALLPEMITLAPPLHVSQDNELVWLNLPSSPPHDHLPAWDVSMCVAGSSNSEARRLMAKAFTSALNLAQQQQLIAHLKKDSKVVFHVGLTPSKLPELVEHNPIIAIEVLLKLMQSNQISDYFSVLVNMEMSLHSMEVVNRLTTAVELPSEFVHLYISNCIQTCQSIKDRFMQNRLVRLFCVFLQSLIRNKVVDIKDIFIEVQAFCIEFSRIREAGALFRLLKTLEGADTSAGLQQEKTPATKW